MSKAQKLRVQGNCLPVSIAKYNLLWFARESPTASDAVKKEYERHSNTCNEILRDSYESLPVYYRESVARNVDSLTKNIYFNYMAKHKFNTGKVFMLLHNWVERLLDDGLIDEPDEGFFTLVKTLTDHIQSGLDGELEKDGIKPDDVQKQYLSAMKHVQKIHNIAMDDGLYIPVEIVEIAV